MSKIGSILGSYKLWFMLCLFMAIVSRFLNDTGFVIILCTLMIANMLGDFIDSYKKVNKKTGEVQ